MLASSMEELFALLPHGFGYLGTCLQQAKSNALHEKRTSDCDGDAWTEAGFPPHPSPAAAVLAAYRASPRFVDWLAGLETTKDDGAEEKEGGFRRFEMEEKFWSIQLRGASHTVRYGKIGTSGQEKTKDFDDEAAARKDHDKLMQEKTRKGYEPVDG